MKKTLLIVGVVGAGLLNQGCLSYMATQSHNDKVKTVRAVQAVRMNDGAPGVGVDLLSLTPGYFAAWSDTPVLMTAATLGDLVTTGAAAYGAYKIAGGGNSSGNGGAGITINGNGNTTIYNGGSGSASASKDSHNNPTP